MKRTSYSEIISGSIYYATGNAIYGSISLTNSLLTDIPMLYLWYPEKDIWSKLRGEEESNLKQSYDEQFIKIAEKERSKKEESLVQRNI